MNRDITEKLKQEYVNKFLYVQAITYINQKLHEFETRIRELEEKGEV